MTDTQKLLGEYVENGSETAFRELVERYVNLVYLTALRLVGGDTQLAEDVSQTVFIGLARKAGVLSRKVMLGGWLHRYTYHVATKAMRQEYRRQAREREALEMSTLQNDPEEMARRVRPILDAALLQLGDEERKAILLRFFEEQDFRAVGAALDIGEDAARMRVSRALGKLHAILTRRGVVLPVAGLSAVLGAEALKAAPAGLAAKLAGGATIAAGGGMMNATLIHIMNATKLKAGLACALLATGVVTSLVLQQRAAARMLEMDDSLRQQSNQSAKLATDNDRLANDLSRANSARSQLDELQKLRATAQELRQKTNELASLRGEQQRLRQQLQSLIQTPLQSTEAAHARMNFAREFVLAFIMYEGKYHHSPAGLDDVVPFLEPDSNANMNRDNFEWVYPLPNISEQTNATGTLVIREIEPSLNDAGKWAKVYGFLDGHSEMVGMPRTANGVSYNSFEAYENDHIATPPAK